MNTDATNKIVIHYTLSDTKVWCGAAVHPKQSNDFHKVTCLDCRRRVIFA